jgi:mono/diheme cytochrome c family protein
MTALARNILLSATACLGLYLLVTGANGASAQPKSDRLAQGKQVYERWCAACHSNGVRSPGTIALAAKYGKDMPAALELRRDLTPELVAVFVRNGVSIMPSFRKTEISDAELAALGAYLATRGPARKR